MPAARQPMPPRGDPAWDSLKERHQRIIENDPGLAGFCAGDFDAVPNLDDDSDEAVYPGNGCE